MADVDPYCLIKWFLARITFTVNHNLHSQFKGLATWDLENERLEKKAESEGVGEREREREGWNGNGRKSYSAAEER